MSNGKLWERLKWIILSQKRFPGGFLPCKRPWNVARTQLELNLREETQSSAWLLKVHGGSRRVPIDTSARGVNSEVLLLCMILPFPTAYFSVWVNKPSIHSQEMCSGLHIIKLPPAIQQELELRVYSHQKSPSATSSRTSFLLPTWFSLRHHLSPQPCFPTGVRCLLRLSVPFCLPVTSRPTSHFTSPPTLSSFFLALPSLCCSPLSPPFSPHLCRSLCLRSPGGIISVGGKSAQL